MSACAINWPSAGHLASSPASEAGVSEHHHLTSCSSVESLYLAGSPARGPAHQHQIVEGSPPHDVLAAPAQNSSTNSNAGPSTPSLLQPLATVLQRCVDLNTAALQQGSLSATQPLTAFHGLRPPPISLAAYLERIAKYAKCSPVCFVMAADYVERLAQADPAFKPSLLNAHRLLITGVLLAAKLMDDHYYSNAQYAKIGGVALEELNALELQMMQLLDYRLRVGALPVTETLMRLTTACDAAAPAFAAAFSSLLIQQPAPQSASAPLAQLSAVAARVVGKALPPQTEQQPLPQFKQRSSSAGSGCTRQPLVAIVPDAIPAC